MAKRRPENQIVNLTLDHEKSRIALIYLLASNVPHTIGKRLMKATILLLDLISIGGLQKKLWASKVARVPISRILGFQLGSPETK
jgi:asparagine synthetase A